MAAMRGVNLGGWLVLERWITPSVFVGTDTHDEYSLCKYLGKNAAVHLDQHRNTFITPADFNWIAAHGFEIIRLPVGYWMFGGEDPYVKCSDYIDFTLNQAKQNNIKVLLDLHGAPGSQNGNDHSGRRGYIDWSKKDNIQKSLHAIDRICQEWAKHPALWGIEVLNEPSLNIKRKTLIQYYKDSYKIIQDYNPRLKVIFSDCFQPSNWHKTELANLNSFVQDSHFYQLFSDQDKTLPTSDRLALVAKWANEIINISQTFEVIVGEWTARLDDNSKDITGSFSEKYLMSQVSAFSHATAWFYWTYKTEHSDLWNLRYSIENKLIRL